MNLFGFDVTFWIASIGAALVRVITSENHSFGRSIMTVFAAVFSAYFFTHPVVHWLGLPPEIYTNPVAALMALTGEGLMRYIITVANDPTKAFDILKAWRGGK